MKPKRFYFVMIGLASLLGLLVIALAIGGNLLFNKQAAKLNELKIESRVVEEQQLALNQAKKDIEKYEELDSITKAIVPQDKNQAKTIRELTTIAAASGIELKTISFATSDLGQPKAAPKPTSNSSDGETAPTTPAVPTTDVTQVEPVEGIPGVFALKITIAPSSDFPVPYYKFIDFLERLESNRRTAHVDQITVTPTEDNLGVSFSLTLSAYLKP